jgi:hypothetical protein
MRWKNVIERPAGSPRRRDEALTAPAVRGEVTPSLLGEAGAAMPWYQCFIRGEKFPGFVLRQRKPVGFYTTRFVEAPDVEAAEAKALAQLKRDKTLAVPRFRRNRMARVHFEEMRELSRRPVKVKTGFVFYDDDT